MIRVIALNELKRRLRDRSVLIGCLAAPLLMSAVLGLSLAGNGGATVAHIGVSGASAQLMAAAVHASQLPPGVTVVSLASESAVKTGVSDGDLDGGVAVLPGQLPLHTMLIPIVDPGATHTPGFDVVSRGTSQLGEEFAESVAAGISSVLYASRVPHDGVSDRATVAITTQSVGHGGKVNLNFFAPNIAVVFLFIGAGLGMRSLLMERSAGTLARITAAPLRPTQIVLGKLLAIFVTGLATIFVIWAVTTLAFGANWGDPLGVVLMCVGATLAVCGIGVFLTSLAKTEQQAFGITMLVGLVSPCWAATCSRRDRSPTPSRCWRWGRRTGGPWSGSAASTSSREPASSIIGPFVVLLVIALVAGGLAMTRVRKMVEP